ncbi:MAG: hypothetical protein ABI642_06530, partial [Polaromonas sp.]
QGSRLSEAKPSSSETPLLPSTAGCPGAKRRGPRPSGRLFFGDFLLAKQKKVTCRRATPGQQADHNSRNKPRMTNSGPDSYQFNSWLRPQAKGYSSKTLATFVFSPTQTENFYCT